MWQFHNGENWWDTSNIGIITILYSTFINNTMTAKQVYDMALLSVAATKAEFLQDLHPHYRNNSYLFSKHILEHLLTEQYHDLPICVVRPSLICSSLDLQDGWYNTKSPVSFVVSSSIAPRYIFMAPRCEGKVNLVLVEDVTNDCMEAVFKLARPASADGNGHLWHPILSSTSHSNSNIISILKGVAPLVPRMGIRGKRRRRLVRTTEFIVVRIAAGKRLPESSRLCTVITTISWRILGILNAGTRKKHRSS
jgi:hypothetical protein